MTLEEKLKRLQEIQQLLEEKKINLSQSMPLLEEAYRLRAEIETELTQMENKLSELSQKQNISE